MQNFFTPKALRIIKNDIRIIFSSKGIMPFDLRAFRESNSREWISREMRFKNGNSALLTDSGYASFRQTVDMLDKAGIFGAQATYGDIWSSVKDSIEELLSNNVQPETPDEFIKLVSEKVTSKIQVRYFVSVVSGLSISKDIDEIKLGDFSLCNASLDVLSKLGAKTDFDVLRECVEEQDSMVWLIGTARGTQHASREVFEYRSRLLMGLVAIFSAANYEGGATSFCFSVQMDAESVPGRAITYAWGEDGEVSVLYKTQRGQGLVFDGDMVSRFYEGGIFERIFASICSDEKPLLSEKLSRALYWFYEAQRDSVIVMQFVKYWSCIETIFGIRDEITQAVARGMATILVAGSYNLKSPDEYVSLKKRIEQLYDLRSKALHEAEHCHITRRHVSDLSQWVAWTLIEVSHLICDGGYQTSEELQQQCSRLNKVLLRSQVKSE